MPAVPAPPPSPSPSSDPSSGAMPLIWMAFSLAAFALLLLALRFACHRRLDSLRGVHDHVAPAGAGAGISPEVLGSIPVFVYAKMNEDDRLECSVCLAEFRERERGRVLPVCYHSFHVDCVDRWFLTHDTCPMCRTAVRLEEPPCGHSHVFGASRD